VSGSDEIEVLAALAADGTIELRSPGVGLWRDAPPNGTLLGPGSAVGRLERLNRRSVLRVPAGQAGRVVRGERDERVLPVGYGELLLSLAALEAAGDASAPSAGPGGSAESALGPGLYAVTAPVDGVFYHRASPGEPAFVTLGARLSRGDTVGLLEVMKTFNPVPYGGASLPAEAEVVEIRCADGEEIRAGQILLVVR